MTKKQLEDYRRKLLKLESDLREEYVQLYEETMRPSGGEPSGQISNVPIHPSDQGADMFEQESEMTMLDAITRTREETRDALQRIDAGTFGRCEECGQTIAPERLEAVPYARYCIGCAEKLQTPPESF